MENDKITNETSKGMSKGMGNDKAGPNEMKTEKLGFIPGVMRKSKRRASLVLLFQSWAISSGSGN